MLNIDISFNRERLIGLFLKTNNLLSDVKITEFDNHFYFEEPIYITDESHNTKVKVVSKLSSKYFGKKTLKYNRIKSIDLPIVVIKQDGELNLYNLLTKINNKYGLFLSSFDLVDKNLVMGNVGDITIDLDFKYSSLIFAPDGPPP